MNSTEEKAISSVLVVAIVGVLVVIGGMGMMDLFGEDSAPATELNGTVEAGIPISDARVTAVGQDGKVLDRSDTDSVGEYTVSYSSARTPTIVASVEGHKSVQTPDPLYTSAVKRARSAETLDFNVSADTQPNEFRGTGINKTGVSFAYHGSGTVDDPYVIANLHQLQAVKKDQDEHYELAYPIDASQSKQWNNEGGLNPIGKYNPNTFDGTLDGNGHEVRNLKVNNSNEPAIGLVSKVGSGTIRNIHLKNADVTGRASVGIVVGHIEPKGTVSRVSSSGTVVGADKVGGVVGLNNGTVVDAVSHATVQTGSKTHDISHAAGGLVGFQPTAGVTKRSYATGDVSGYDDIGGLVGHNYGLVTESYATGSVLGRQDTGGFAGKNGQANNINGTIRNSYATVDVETTLRPGVGGLPVRVAEDYQNAVAGDQEPAGGFVGFNQHSSVVKNSYWNEDVQTKNLTLTDQQGIATGNESVHSLEQLPAEQMRGDAVNAKFESDILGDAAFQQVSGAFPQLLIDD